MDQMNHNDQRNEARSYGPIGAPIIIAVLISTAISLAATGISMLLNRPKNPRTPFDSTATPLSQRGVMVPNLYGRRRLSFTFAWAGNRKSTSHKGVRTYYESAWHVLCVGPVNALHGIYEDGKPIYPFTLNPVSAPSGTTITVTNHGKFRIFWGECDQPNNHDFAKGGINKDGSPAYPGVDSRWPGVCYVEWIDKKLGFQPQWKRLEYEVERRGYSDVPTLTSAASWLDMTTLPNKVDGTTVYSATYIPAGTYTVTFTGGACKWSSNFGWSVQDPASTKLGFYVVNPKGTKVMKLPGTAKQFATAGACAAANSGKHATLKWPGGKVGVTMADDHYTDNLAGTPNPTWEFTDGMTTFSLEGVVQNGVTRFGSADSGMNPAHVMWQILTGTHPYGMGIPVDVLDADSFDAVAAACDAERLVMNLGGDPSIDARTNLENVMIDAGIFLTQAGHKLRAVLLRPNFLPRQTIPLDANADPAPTTIRVHGEVVADRTTFYIKDRTRNYKANDHLGTGDQDALALSNSRPRTAQIELPTITDTTTGAKVAGRRALDATTDSDRIEFSATRNASDCFPGMPVNIEGRGDYIITSNTPAVLTPYARLKAAFDQYGRGADDSSAPGAYAEGFGFDGPDAFVTVVQAPSGLAPTSTVPYVVVLRIREDVDVLNASVLISADDSNYIDIGDVPFCTGGTLNSSIPASEALADAEGPTITTAGPDFADLVEDLTGRDREYDAGRQLCLIDNEWFKLRKVTAVSGGYRLDGLTRAQYGSVAADHDDNAPVFIVKRENVVMFQHVLMSAGDTAYFKVQPNDASEFPAIELDGLQPIPVDFA